MTPRKLCPHLAVFAMVALSSALALVSCSKNPFGRFSRETAPLEARGSRPGPSDESGWYSAQGPERLDKYQYLPLDRGEGILDAQVLGTELLILDSLGFVSRIPGSQALPRDAAGALPILPLLPPGESGHPPAAAFAGFGSALYIASEDGQVRALMLLPPDTALAGALGYTPIWSWTPAFKPDWLLAADGFVVCVSADGKLSALSASDGSAISFLDLGTPLNAKPALAGKILLLPRASGITAFSLPDMKFLWTRDIASARVRPIRTVAGVFAFEDANGVFCVWDASAGEERYSINAGAGAEAACDGERWYLAGADGSLGAYNLADGVPVWTAGSPGAPDALPQARARYFPRLAVTEGRVYFATLEGVEVWNSVTGEREARVSSSDRVDGLYVLPGALFARMRGGGFLRFGTEWGVPAEWDLEAAVRPPAAAADRIAISLGKYSGQSGGPELAWRVYVPGASPSPDARFTVFRYELAGAGKHVFSTSPETLDGALIALYDSNGEERHVNAGELGLDRSFEQWMEPGIWYAVFGLLRAYEGEEPVFLDIR